MKLDYLMTYEATLKPAQPVGKGPYGTRQIAEVTGGHFEGPRLKGQILTCGGDWILVDDVGIGHLDVRVTFRTDDDAHIYAQYTGVLEFNDRIAQAFASGGGTEFGDSYFMTQPRFETGDERYAWLNRLVTVGQGKLIPGGVAVQRPRHCSDNPGAATRKPSHRLSWPAHRAADLGAAIEARL